MPGFVRGVILFGSSLMWIGGWAILPFSLPLAAPLISAGIEIVAIAASAPPNLLYSP